MRLSEDAKSQKWLSTLGNIQGYALENTNLLNSMLFVDIRLSYSKAVSGSYFDDIINLQRKWLSTLENIYGQALNLNFVEVLKREPVIKNYISMKKQDGDQSSMSFPAKI